MTIILSSGPLLNFVQHLMSEDNEDAGKMPIDLLRILYLIIKETLPNTRWGNPDEYEIEDPVHHQIGITEWEIQEQLWLYCKSACDIDEIKAAIEFFHLSGWAEKIDDASGRWVASEGGFNHFITLTS